MNSTLPNRFYRYIACILCLVSIGCKQNQVPSPTTENNAIPNLPTLNQSEPNLLPTSNTTLLPSSPNSPINAIKKLPFPHLSWLITEYGQSTWHYEKKLTDTKLSKQRYAQLFRTILEPEPLQGIQQQQAAYGLQYSLYQPSEKWTSQDMKPYMALIYDPEIVKELAKESPTIIQHIPRTLPNYLNLVQQSIEQNPLSFDALPLQVKLNDIITTTLFYASDFHHYGSSLFQKLAIQYASENVLKNILSQDGLLLKYANPEMRANPSIVSAAYSQNKEAIIYAHPTLQSIIKKSGKKGLKKAPTSTTNIPVLTTTEVVSTDNQLTIYEQLPIYQVETNLNLIQLIERQYQQPLQYLWKIADVYPLGYIYVAVFIPENRHHLGALLFISPDHQRILAKDFPATRDLTTPNSIWYPNDKGGFGPENFTIFKVMHESSTNQLQIDAIWIQNDNETLLELREGQSLKALQVSK